MYRGIFVQILFTPHVHRYLCTVFASSTCTQVFVYSFFLLCKYTGIYVQFLLTPCVHRHIDRSAVNCNSQLVTGTLALQGSYLKDKKILNCIYWGVSHIKSAFTGSQVHFTGTTHIYLQSP
ncbi:hypothetical protein CHS0354_026125 [Potamilus streckersoni]|uniref:Uncharacterized protein n=1 Tax=Potamilus streckersoni TaxID=2493646 RepID=A0AAE0S1E8_9BIVA|nr:hypothetical protein CHS0354_026125 [Potamilus streckersoni]